MSAKRMLLCKLPTRANLGLQDNPHFEEACPKKPKRGDVMGALRAGMDKLVAATQSTLQGIGSIEVVQRFWVCLQVCPFAGDQTSAFKGKGSSEILDHSSPRALNLGSEQVLSLAKEVRTGLKQVGNSV